MTNILIKKIAILLGGNLGAQIITILSMMVITRIYQPESFGLYSIFVSLISVLIPISTVCLTLAFFLESKESNLKKIFNTNIFLALCFFVFLSCLIFIIKLTNFISAKFINDLGSLIYLVPISVLLGSLYDNYYQYSLKLEKYNKISKSVLFSSFLSNIYKIISGYGVAITINLVFGYFLNYILQIIILLKSNILPKIKIHKYDVKYTISKYKLLIFFRTPQVFLSTISEFIPILFLANYYGAKEVGYYSLARSILSAPTVLVGKSITDVFLSKLSLDLNNNLNINKILVKSVIVSFFISVLIYLPFIFYGDWLFSLIFGNKWEESGKLASVMCFWLIGVLSTRTIVAAMTVKNLQKKYLAFEIVFLFFKILILFFGVESFTSYIDVILGFSLINFLFYFMLIFLCIFSKD
ncbi:hypothetical protein B9T38_10425 [Acinetobacter sp. ANC 4218]|uniref:lipopolysaccharide biosynthesis protein n=1 Tax=Acinetobacter sp. ANC 4218 TaxID=1977880 RepID=UPI000A35A143|nr:oligosaccharide flippase family protein [Acinetobacter sp. ANC 4218]OTG71205.1 hypothetical protein B9T38_10425 [Acinetobacter sp. ANC 4218]